MAVLGNLIDGMVQTTFYLTNGFDLTAMMFNLRVIIKTELDLEVDVEDQTRHFSLW